MKKIESRKKFQLKNNNNLFVVSIFLCVWKNCKTLSVSDQIVHGSATLKKINRSNISWPCFLKANYGDGFQNMEQSLSSFQPTPFVQKLNFNYLFYLTKPRLSTYSIAFLHQHLHLSNSTTFVHSTHARHLTSFLT